MSKSSLDKLREALEVNGWRNVRTKWATFRVGGGRYPFKGREVQGVALRAETDGYGPNASEVSVVAGFDNQGRYLPQTTAQGGGLAGFYRGAPLLQLLQAAAHAGPARRREAAEDEDRRRQAALEAQDALVATEYAKARSEASRTRTAAVAAVRDAMTEITQVRVSLFEAGRVLDFILNAPPEVQAFIDAKTAAERKSHGWDIPGVEGASTDGFYVNGVRHPWSESA